MAADTLITHSTTPTGLIVLPGRSFTPSVLADITTFHAIRLLAEPGDGLDDLLPAIDSASQAMLLTILATLKARRR